MILAERIARLVKLSGKPAAAAYLKIAVISCYQYRAGSRIKPWVLGSGKPIVALDVRGLPKIVPWELRIGILSHSLPIFRAVVSLLNLYRGLHFRGRLNTQSITQSGISRGLRHELRTVTRRFFRKNTIAWNGFHWQMLFSAGPNGKRSMWATPLDALAFVLRPRELLVISRVAPWTVTLWICCLGWTLWPFFCIHNIVARLIPGGRP